MLVGVGPAPNDLAPSDPAKSPAPENAPLERGQQCRASAFLATLGGIAIFPPHCPRYLLQQAERKFERRSARPPMARALWHVWRVPDRRPSLPGRARTWAPHGRGTHGDHREANRVGGHPRTGVGRTSPKASPSRWSACAPLPRRIQTQTLHSKEICPGYNLARRGPPDAVGQERNGARASLRSLLSQSLSKRGNGCARVGRGPQCRKAPPRVGRGCPCNKGTPAPARIRAGARGTRQEWSRSSQC
jgi:hypothetical protein